MTVQSNRLHATELDIVTGVIAGRRTSLLVDRGRAVPIELIEQLCELAAWAPCHKRTWPWVFTAFTGDGRRRLGAAAGDALAAHGLDQAKVDKARTKYLRAPAMLVVGSRQGESAMRTAENRDAVAAAVQNLLLGATAAGLASYWSSCPTGAERAVAEVSGFEPGTTIVAVVYLGWPTSPCVAPERPPVTLTHIGHA
jgi:nitroreductase